MSITVQKVICKCGKARMLSVNVPGQEKTKEIKKEIAKLVNAGLDVVTIPLEEAKQTEMCFDCKVL